MNKYVYVGASYGVIYIGALCSRDWTVNSRMVRKKNLNPKMDLEEAIKQVEMLTAKNKSKRTKSRNPGYNC